MPLLLDFRFLCVQMVASFSLAEKLAHHLRWTSLSSQNREKAREGDVFKRLDLRWYRGAIPYTFEVVL